MTQREQVAITSRVFCLAAILGLALVARDPKSWRASRSSLSWAARRPTCRTPSATPRSISLTAETLVVGIITGVTFPQSVVLMPYLVVLPLLAGLFRGFPGVLIAMLAQVAAVVVVPAYSGSFEDLRMRALALAPWLLTTFGGGLLGVWARSLGISQGIDQEHGNYESARQLLTQLRAVARRLSAGLDSDGMAAQLMVTMHEHLDDSYAAVFVKMRGSVLVPLGYRGIGGASAAASQRPHGRALLGRHGAVHRRRAVRKPRGSSPGRPPAARRAPDDRRGRVVLGATGRGGRLAALMREVEGHSLRLDTALVFDEIRSMATADERQRLAREIHDGIAQEIASLGYVVDHMASTTRDPSVAQGLRDLRGELSRVVADLRLSIFDLRSDISPTNGLGSALSDYVRQVGAKSGPDRAPDPRRGSRRGCPAPSRPSCCASRRRPSPTPASTPRRRTSGSTAGPTRRTRASRCATTAAGSTVAATTPTASRSCGSARSASTQRSTSPPSPTQKTLRGTTVKVKVAPRTALTPGGV